MTVELWSLPPSEPGAAMKCKGRAD